MTKPGRPGASRKKKTPKVGSGGQGRQALEGRGPTPKAEDRSYHVAGKRKAAADRNAQAVGRAVGRGASPRSGRAAPGQGGAADASIAERAFAEREQARRRPPKAQAEAELVTGRNSVLEAFAARIPAHTLYLAQRIEFDDRVKQIIASANGRNLPIVEVTRQELDRMTDAGTVHQGVALKVPPYQYVHPLELLDSIEARGGTPLLVALDGVTDPRNLGAIVRSTAAFGGQGVIVPQRRAAGMTAAAWKTSAGAAARIPVAMASNLAQTLAALKARGVLVLGLDGDGDVALPELALAEQPLAIVVGSEGKGLSRIVTEACDAIVAIPISSATESLNAGIAASVALYEVARLRSRS
ncbi:MAG: 23S rRNA (guanosine(2251)-2'-O)-methyltransferase RlmB [Micrococcales bacterium 73-13]|nr:MAG: 23S rRNA (guanosine(2251)-2'-O)-methyltransferase RlmB [Micrococcales bacterium 73-13]